MKGGKIWFDLHFFRSQLNLVVMNYLSFPVFDVDYLSHVVLSLSLFILSFSFIIKQGYRTGLYVH
jgi:hypothetical protein